MIHDVRLGKLALTPIVDADYRTLYQWRNSAIYLNSITTRKELNSYEAFVRETSEDFYIDKHLHYLIRASDKSLGTIFSYAHDRVNQFVFVSAFLDKRLHFTGLGAKSAILFSHYLFEFHEVYKIYFDVYGDNRSVIGQMKKVACLEGQFRNQLAKNGSRLDVYRFALYAEQLEPYDRLLEKCKIIPSYGDDHKTKKL